MNLYNTYIYVSSFKIKTFIKYKMQHITSVAYSYLPTPPLRQDMTQGQFLSGV